MKVFYIFDIKEEFKYLYKDNLDILFNILKEIYYLYKYEENYSESLLRQIVNEFNKDKIDMNLFIRLHLKMPYSKRGEVHYMNNLYKNEISRLIVREKFIKIEAENKTSSFLEILTKYNNNLFACDFKNNTFFYLKDCFEKIS